jgi:hypothetical protein
LVIQVVTVYVPDTGPLAEQFDPGVGDGVGLAVGVGVGVDVGVGDGVGDGVGVGVGVAVSVGSGVGDGVADGEGVAASTISSGGVADSRLPRLSAVALVVVSTRLTGPFPPTSGVTSTSYHVPPMTGPLAPVAVGEYAGALL